MDLDNDWDDDDWDEGHDDAAEDDWDDDDGSDADKDGDDGNDGDGDRYDPDRAPICRWCGVTTLPAHRSNVIDSGFACDNDECDAYGEAG